MSGLEKSFPDSAVDRKMRTYSLNNLFLIKHVSLIWTVIVLSIILSFQGRCAGGGPMDNATAAFPGDGKTDETGVLQRALNQKNGPVFLPLGRHKITRALNIPANSGFWGYGTIVQHNPNESIFHIADAVAVTLRNISLTRADGKQETTCAAIDITRSRRVCLENLTLSENHSRRGTISITDSRSCTIKGCRILNYKRIAVDDRTADPIWGYAFHCIDGTGIWVARCQGTQILNNRIIENRLLPTRENKAKYKLGELTKGTHPNHEGVLGKWYGAFENQYVNNWHQGSAVLVASPADTSHTLIQGNYLEHCAQGFDIHSDYVIVSDNIVDFGMTGIKLYHGVKHAIVRGNLLSHIDCLGITMASASSSHAACGKSKDKPALPANLDQGNIISNNIIADFGYGDEYWNWKDFHGNPEGGYAIHIANGQLSSNPPLHDVILQGNIVYNSGKDGILRDNKVEHDPPRYRYALYVSTDQPSPPKNIYLQGNLLAPGSQGVCNVPIGVDYLNKIR